MMDNASLFYNPLHLISLQRNYLTLTVPYGGLVGFFLMLTLISPPLQIKTYLIISQIIYLYLLVSGRVDTFSDSHL